MVFKPITFDDLEDKKAFTQPESVGTGPNAIFKALDGIDLEALERATLDAIKNGSKSKRSKYIKRLNAIHGLKRSEVKPSELMISKVPVIPARFRPFSVIGETFTPGDSNELYRDLIQTRDSYMKVRDELGEGGSNDGLVDLYDATKAVYGFGEPISESSKQRDLSGFMKKIVGSGPKYSFVQSKMLSKTQDSVGRSVVTVDPELSLNQIGLPADMAWKIYSPYVQKRLRLSGMSGVDAVKAIKDKTDAAKRALDAELNVRPVMYSRAPAWHKFNSIGGYVKLHDGNSIAVNPLITDGQNMDFDGDTINIHVPSSDEALEDVKNKLLPSNMLFSNAEADKVIPQIKHETLLSLYTSNKRPAKNKLVFNSEQEALEAINAGQVALSDDITIAGM